MRLQLEAEDHPESPWLVHAGTQLNIDTNRLIRNLAEDGETLPSTRIHS